MNSIWQQVLGATGARFDHDLVTDFGDPAAELMAARAATIVSPLEHLRVIEVAGPDAGAFLHNQLTSDVKHLASDAVQHSAWCSAKGRMLASFLVFRGGPDYQLQLSADLLTTILKRLRMFVLRSQVTIVDRSGSRELIGVSGPQAAAVVQAAGLPVPGDTLTSAVFAKGLVIRLAGTRFEIVSDGEAAPALWRGLQSHARPVGTTVWQWLDIQAGIPLVSARTTEEFVPQMANFERLGGVSFHKGCYPGQEVVARTQYLGKVKRHLYALQLASAAEAGEAVFSSSSPERACGMIANAAPAPDGGYVALAVLQEGLLNGQLHLGSVDGPLVTRLQPLGD